MADFALCSSDIGELLAVKEGDEYYCGKNEND
jgi:hypothetical protein